MVRSSFSILFFIRESKARKNGSVTIEAMITVNGERCSFSTGKQVAIEKWDKLGIPYKLRKVPPMDRGRLARLSQLL